MPSRRTYDSERCVHFLTFSCYRRRKLLRHAQPAKIVVGQLARRLADRDGLCLGFVIMPDHVHAMVWFPESGRLAEFMDVWKAESSKTIGRYLAEYAGGYRNAFDERTVWQPRYYDFNVLTAAKAEEKLDYMHANPVRAGLVTRPSEYRWSSARWYESGRPVGIPIGWPDGFD
ncbi:MAG: transposase [Planctomycetota bacterium]